MNIITRAVAHVLSHPESFTHEGGIGCVAGVSMTGFEEWRLMCRADGVPVYLADAVSVVCIGTLHNYRCDDVGTMADLHLPPDSEFLAMFANLAMWGAAGAARFGGGR